jgi:3-hydroxyisobutyrate dehydrogenase-like beta-hydroxyacid dehydrogenase
MRVGVVGLGVMGRPMVERLLTAGHEVIVWNRTTARAAEAAGRGARVARSPADLASHSDVVLSIVTDPEAVRAVSLGDDGIAAGLAAGSVHADMSTVSPEASRSLAAEYARRSLRFVQAPVLGSRRQIAAGELLVFGGGSEEDVQRAEEAWSAFASRTWRLPDAPAGAALKLACNMLIANMILGLGQSLVFARALGVDPSILLEVLGASALGAPMYASKGRTLVARNFDANFYVRHMLKDLTLASDAGRDAGVPLPLNALARELFVAAEAQGWGTEDYSAVVKVLEQMAGQSLR